MKTREWRGASPGTAGFYKGLERISKTTNENVPLLAFDSGIFRTGSGL